MIDRSLFLSADQQTFDGKRAVPNEVVTKLMLELADLRPGEKVLEIGTGSGYQTKCLCATGAEVFTIDREARPDIGPSNLADGSIGIRLFSDGDVSFGAMFTLGDGRNGWQTNAPFDCIFVTCGTPSIPPAYEEQLREGGRLIIPLGKSDGQELLRLEKRNGKLVLGRVGGYCRFQMAV